MATGIEMSRSRIEQIEFLMLPASIWNVWGKWSTPAELCIIAATHTLNTLKIRPRNKDIAQLAGCSLHSVERALHKLEHFNFNRTGWGNPHTREIEVLIPPDGGRHFFKLPVHGSPLDRLLKGIIGALSQPTGWCTAGDAYFAEHGIAKDTLHRWMRSAKSSGLTAVTYYDSTECQWHRRMKFSTDILSTTSHTRPEGHQPKSYPYTRQTRTHTPAKIVQDREYIEIDRVATPSVAHSFTHTQSESNPQPQRASGIVVIENHYLETVKRLKDAGTLAILPARNIAQERGLLAKRIKEYGLDTCKKVIDAAARDEWCIGKGFTLSMILAANEFNILANGGVQAKRGTHKQHSGSYTYQQETPAEHKAKVLAIQQRLKDLEAQPIRKAAHSTAAVVSSLGLFKEHFALDVANLEAAAETKPIDFETERKRQKEQVEIWLQAHPEQRDGVHIAEHCHTARVVEQTNNTPCQTPMRVSSGYLKDQIEQLKALYEASSDVLELAF